MRYFGLGQRGILRRVFEGGVFRRGIEGILRERIRGCRAGIIGVAYAIVDARDKTLFEIRRILPADPTVLFLHNVDRRNGNFQHFGVFDFFVHKKISFFLSVSFCFNL